jgi:regulator of sirC expression with transglutaminase-like and TPR domain
VAEVDVTAQFEAHVQGPERELRLDRAALLIAAHAYPGLDVDAEAARLDALAESCFAPTLDALVRHLFVDEGFRGNRDDYYDPRNSLLNDVLDRRLGIPITLAVLAMEVGRRLGVPMSGVGMPGHFLLRDRVDPDVFVDPFSRGAVTDRRGAEARFHAVQGAGARFDESFLEPIGPRAIVARMLANLKAAYLQRNERASLAWVLRLRVAVPGVPVTERAELARILGALGDWRGAAAELEELAELVPAERQRHLSAAVRLRARLN